MKSFDFFVSSCSRMFAAMLLPHPVPKCLKLFSWCSVEFTMLEDVLLFGECRTETPADTRLVENVLGDIRTTAAERSQ